MDLFGLVSYNNDACIVLLSVLANQISTLSLLGFSCRPNELLLRRIGRVLRLVAHYVFDSRGFTNRYTCVSRCVCINMCTHVVLSISVLALAG